MRHLKRKPEDGGHEPFAEQGCQNYSANCSHFCCLVVFECWLQGSLMTKRSQIAHCLVAKQACKSVSPSLLNPLTRATGGRWHISVSHFQVEQGGCKMMSHIGFRVDRCEVLRNYSRILKLQLQLYMLYLAPASQLTEETS